MIGRKKGADCGIITKQSILPHTVNIVILMPAKHLLRKPLEIVVIPVNDKRIIFSNNVISYYITIQITFNNKIIFIPQINICFNISF